MRVPCSSSSCVNALQSLLHRFTLRGTVPTEAEKVLLDRVGALLRAERRSPTQCLLVETCVRRSGTPTTPDLPGQADGGVRVDDGTPPRP